MKLRNSAKAAGAALLLLMGGISTANALPCATAPAATWEAPGFSCTVDGLTFSGFQIQTIGLVVLGNFSPVTLIGPNGQTEFGFQLGYSANTNGINTTADVLLNYTVASTSGLPIIEDAYMSLTGGTGGDGARVTLDETLSPNGVTLHLGGPGVVDVTFPNIASLFAVKDQNNFAGLTFATSSSIIDAFSVCVPGTPGCVVNPPVEVPEPSSMIVLGSGLLGLAAFIRRRRKGRDGTLSAA